MQEFVKDAGIKYNQIEKRELGGRMEFNIVELTMIITISVSVGILITGILLWLFGG